MIFKDDYIDKFNYNNIHKYISIKYVFMKDFNYYYSILPFYVTYLFYRITENDNNDWYKLEENHNICVLIINNIVKRIIYFDNQMYIPQIIYIELPYNKSEIMSRIYFYNYPIIKSISYYYNSESEKHATHIDYNINGDMIAIE